MELDIQTRREIELHEAALKEANERYTSHYGPVKIDREEGAMYIGYTEGSYLWYFEYNPELPIWLNIMMAEEEIDKAYTVEDEDI